jgi:16S rRNA (cytosine1402-N4)-methyltransferase
MTEKLSHTSIMLTEILSFLPDCAVGKLLDVTAGGGGHFFAMLKARKNWTGECWDRDPLAQVRVQQRARDEKISNEWSFARKTFSSPPQVSSRFNFILADIGISSFQIDDPLRGMSLFSEQPVDFRMDPEAGVPFSQWLSSKSVFELEQILEVYGEEPKAQKLARWLKELGGKNKSGIENLSAKEFAEMIRKILAYPPGSRTHPATRSFQAFRIAINDELGELKALLNWAPQHLLPGGRLAVMSFHSLEDRLVKKAFQDLASSSSFVILNSKPLVASEIEVTSNPRSRSAKLRILERKG